MSDTPKKTAEPTENQGGGTAASPIPTESPLALDEDPEAPAAEPPDNQGGGGD